MSLTNTDLFVVQRGNSLFKVPSSTLKLDYTSTTSVIVSANPPLNPVQGDLWWSTVEGKYQRTIEIKDYEENNSTKRKASKSSDDDLTISDLSKRR